MGCDFTKFTNFTRWLRNAKACKLDERERKS